MINKFLEMDVDKNGILDREEVKQILLMSGEEVTKELVETIFDILDGNDDGHI